MRRTGICIGSNSADVNGVINEAKDNVPVRALYQIHCEASGKVREVNLHLFRGE